MSDTVACRICLEETGVLISPCGCKGSAANVHEKCLKKWVAESGSETCEICKEEYARRETIGCNITNYFDGVFRSRFTSQIESNLVRFSSLHMILGILMYSWSSMDYWMLLTSIQTVAHSVSIILFQLCNYHLEFFVLRVMIYWSCAYLLSILVVGTIRTMDNEEECTMNCMKLSQVMGCSDTCVVYHYYQQKDMLAGNAMLVRFVETMFLIGIRCIALCFTHMRRSEYYNFKRNPLSPRVASDGSEEEDSLLSPELDSSDSV